MISRKLSRRVLSSLLLFGLLCVSARASFAQRRPTAPRLLPEDTLIYLRIEDVPKLIERFRDTALGRITGDPQVQPFVGHLYQSAVGAFSQLEDRVGLSLGELLELPQGELCVAVVAREDGGPELVFLADLGHQLVQVERLLTRVDDELGAMGATRSVEEVDGTEIVTHQLPVRSRQLNYFTRDETIVVTSNTHLAKQLLTVWRGSNEFKTMADNRAFTGIMSRCNGFRGERPQITWYANPIEFIRRVGRGNLSAQVGLVTMATLGLDGLRGVGGSIIQGTEEFDSIFHAHVLLKSPRQGIMKMIALGAGDVTPEPWVPEDAANYTTFHWDVNTTYNELSRLYDSFYNEGAWQELMASRVSNQLGVDLEQQILAGLTGRVSMVTWIEKPARLNSQATLFGFKLADAKKFSDTLDQMAERLQDRVNKESYGSTTIYLLNITRRREVNPDIVRQQQPCAAVVGDYVILTDSLKFLKEVIATKRDSQKSLANELDFKLIANKIERQLGENQAGLVSFDRPEEGFRLLYGLAVSPETRARLAAREQNPFFKALHDALEEKPLPPFSVLVRYLAPGGAMLTNDETGFHYTAFTLRRK